MINDVFQLSYQGKVTGFSDNIKSLPRDDLLIFSDPVNVSTHWFYKHKVLYAGNRSQKSP